MLKVLEQLFFLTSARGDLNIKEMFEYIGNKIFDKFVTVDEKGEKNKKNSKKVGHNSKDSDGKNKKCKIY